MRAVFFRFNATLERQEFSEAIGVAGTFFPRVHPQKKAADKKEGPKKPLPFPVRLVSFWHPFGGRKRWTFNRPFSYWFRSANFFGREK